MDIVQHALNNLWSNPNSSHDEVITLKRISKPEGVRNRFKLVMTVVDTPTSDLYHIYQIGQLHPADLGIKEDDTYLSGMSTWRSLKDIINHDNVYISVYTDSGLMMPFAFTFITFTVDRDLLVAVRNDFRVQIDGELFLRTRRDQGTVTCKSLDYSDVSMLSIVNSYFSACVESSIVYCNGRYIHNQNQVQLSSLVEVIDDSSVQRVYAAKLTSLDSFNSTVDARLKYFIHDLYATGVWYARDVDVFIYYVDPNTPALELGRYCPRNSESTLRNLTTTSFSLSTVAVGEMVSVLAKEIYGMLKDVSKQIYIKLLMRTGSGTKVFVSGSSRIGDILRLPAGDRNRLMVGSEATLDIWNVTTLESSPYCKLMSSPYTDINPDLVMDAYGYNNACQVLAPVLYTVTPSTSFSIPPFMQNNSTLYMYDAAGKFMLEMVILNYSSVNIPSGVTSVEFVPGHASNEVTITGVDSVQLPLDDKVEWRLYVKLYAKSTWQDMTDDSSSYTIDQNRVLTWTNPAAIEQMLLRTSKSHLLHKFTLDPDSGNLEFKLSEFRTPTGQVKQHKLLEVPFGDLDIWMNGMYLIEGLDYTVEFPQVVITNVNYIVSGSQSIVYRFSGFCSSDFKFNTLQERGWTQHGLVSTNNHVDLHGDRIETVAINGKYVSATDMAYIFRDTYPSGRAYSNDVSGLPYCIKHRVIPLNGLCSKDTEVLLTESLSVDKKLSDFLSLKYPINDTGIAPIGGKYRVLSPMLARIIFYLENGLMPSTLLTAYTVNDLETYLAESDGFMQSFEPNLDTDYAIRVPHRLSVPMSVSAAEFRVIQGVNDLYKLGVDMSTNFTVTL
jgi:hypothetical protein